jgi:predicted ATP-dependent serine protease
LVGSDRTSCGVAGLDEILDGGFVSGRLHLVEGKPGTGKTTLALQFVMAGRDQSEATLYVSGDFVLQKPYRMAVLSESVAECLRCDDVNSASNVVAMKRVSRRL